MGLINKSISVFRTVKPRYEPEKYGAGWFYPIFKDSSITWDAADYLKDYLQVPEVNAIISKKVRAFSNMNLRVVSKKTMKETPGKINKLLKAPNYYQSSKEFLIQTKLFFELWGNEYLYFLTPVGMNGNIKAMFTIPQMIVKVKAPDSSPYFQEVKNQITYQYIWDKKTYNFPDNSILHINKNKANVTEKDYVTGNSPLSALNAPIKNIRAAYEARNVLIENRGALGILSNNQQDATGATLPMDPKEKDKLQTEFKKYGMTKNQWQVILTNLKLNWQQMAIDADKLQLFEETKEDTIKIADQYGVPYELLGNQKGVTYANKNEAKKELYQDTIIPEAQEWVNALNNKLELENQSYEIVATFDHIQVLQQDMKFKAQTLLLVTNALSKAFADGAIEIKEYQKELERYLK